MILAVFSPVDQLYAAKLPLLNIELPFAQKVVLPLMFGCGAGFCVTIKSSLPIQPLVSVTVTLYVPPFTVIVELLLLLKLQL